jgi:predicted porin
MKNSLLIAGMVLGLGLSAHAQHRKSLHDEFTGQGYGMAGCGLGSIVFGQQPGMVQVFAATTNSWGGQTFAISSGTSNCGESGKNQATYEFIKVNKATLEKEVVRGQGETLASLGQMLECKNENFSQSVKANYSREFPSGGATEGQLEAIALKACNI